MMKPSDFRGPLEPQLAPIEAIHRGLDGYVRFLRQDRETQGLEVVDSVRASDLRSWFPEFVEQLRKDSYYTLNSFYKGATHVTGDLRYLNSCYADLDHTALTFGQALQQITDLQDLGVIPPASIIGRSGKGAWLFWLLRGDEKPDQPPRAYPEKIELYLRIELALHHLLREATPELGADPNALDASRITRVPGSIHSGARRRVQYVPQILEGDTATLDRNRNGVWLTAELPVYTLGELAEFLELTPERSFEQKLTKRTKRVPERRVGLVVIAQRRLADLRTLEAARGGFVDGERNRAAFCLLKFLRDLGHSTEEIREEVIELAANCKPPLSKREITKVLERDPGKVKTEKLAVWLRVTPEETKRLPLKEIYYGYSRPRQTLKGRAERRQKRLEVLLDLLSRFAGLTPTVSQLELLLQAAGCEVSRATVWKDAQKVGFVFQRRAKATQTDQTKLFDTN